ncbi:hypothetical protein NQ317_013760 [Molorchus minor]|uniref:Transporter n=1 Tax=Molorchus minor TaxID=1323400 RepID=A0ABQ9JR54_9CUCU|nr:hypothetical protein NQ317_013760 [Molorchus minor]
MGLMKRAVYLVTVCHKLFCGGYYSVLAMEKEQEANKSVPERSSWNKPLEFVLSCLCYAVGLGNVWRFPYLCYRNGGGAFLLAYLIMLVLMGMPIFLLELVVGQYSGLGPDQAFKRMAPIFNGLGYCTLVVIAFVTVYYMVIIAWTLFYLFASFTSELGYGSCDNAFNSMGCYSATQDAKCMSDETFFNKTCILVNDICRSHNYTHAINRTYCSDEEGNAVPINRIITRTLATAEYFREYVLGIGDADWYNFGGIRWELVGCLLFAWVIGYLCVVKGVKTSGKAVYFTALFPYTILTALVVQGCIQEGAIDGIRLYIVPPMGNAFGHRPASQTFYSFGIACGSLITLASYNSFTNNCVKDVLIVSGANAFTSVYAGFAIFGMLGFLANKMGVPVEDVASDGPGLAFVAYPEAILSLPAPTVWSLLFFFMLFILGLGCQFAGVEAISCLIMDKWPQVRKRQVYLTIGICTTCFIFAIPMCFSGGIYIFTLMEWNTASWAILLIGFSEAVVVSWVYGCNKFLDNMADMGMNLSKWARYYWWTSWVIITPLSLLGIFAFQMSKFSRTYYEDYIFPIWADLIGWLIGLATLAPLFIFGGWVLWKGKYRGWSLLKPTNNWGPQCGVSDSKKSLAPSSRGSGDLRPYSVVLTLQKHELYMYFDLLYVST